MLLAMDPENSFRGNETISNHLAFESDGNVPDSFRPGLLSLEMDNTLRFVAISRSATGSDPLMKFSSSTGRAVLVWVWLELAQGLQKREGVNLPRTSNPLSLTSESGSVP